MPKPHFTLELPHFVLKTIVYMYIFLNHEDFVFSFFWGGGFVQKTNFFDKISGKKTENGQNRKFCSERFVAICFPVILSQIRGKSDEK